MNNEVYTLRKSNRIVYPFPWTSTKIPCPWKAGYMRVVMPLTESEKRNSAKHCHIQVVKISNLDKHVA